MTRLSDEELTEAFAYAHGSLRLTAALSELKERRAADLSAEDRSALNFALSVVKANTFDDSIQAYRVSSSAAISVLSKLLDGGREKP